MNPILTTELRLHLRHGSLSAVAAVTVMWVVVLLVAPAEWRSEIGSWAMFFDLAGIGLFFVPALTVLERGSGMGAALRLVPVEAHRFLAARIGVVAVLASIGGVAVLGVAGADGLVGRVSGVFGLSVLLSSAAIVALGSASALPEYLGRLPILVVPFLVPPLLEGSGLVEGWGMGISPVTSAMRLIRGLGGWEEVLWLGSWCVATAFVAARTWRTAGSVRAGLAHGADRRVGRNSIIPGSTAWRSMAAVDRRTLAGDRLLLLVLAGIPLIATAVRWLGAGGAGWLERRWGVDIVPHIPAAWAFVLAAHLPMMVGAVAGLVFLEDRDLGVLRATRTTRWSVAGLLVWRLTVTAGVAAIGFVVCVPIAGAVPPAGPAGVTATALACGALAALVAVSMAAFGRDRVQGMAIMKAVGLPFYAPIALWFVGGAGAAALHVVPTAWVIRSFWAATPAAAWAWALAGVAWMAVLGSLAIRRFIGSVA